MKQFGTSAALAGIPSGLQARGPWAGRRQLFVRFAAEAETATMYTAAALAGEIKRLASRSPYHSLSIAGRDPLGNAEFLQAVFASEAPPLPVLLDCDGDRPEAIDAVHRFVTLVQVTVDTAAADSVTERAVATLHAAAKAGIDHALVLTPRDETSDGQLLRIVEQAHGASEKTMIFLEVTGGAEGAAARRWTSLAERVAGLHGDVRVTLRLPPPIGTR
ncbi:MAG: hypothetical protein NVS1B4_19800 [Gemmatimonadaceae bacterium]